MSRNTATLEWGAGRQGRQPRARRRRTWSATPATRRGRRAAAAVTCRSRRTAKTERHHYEGGETRNYATYNPQVARDDMFLLGRREPAARRQDRAGALVLGAGAVVDELEPRAHLHAAAADRGERLTARRRSTRTIRTPSARPRRRPAPTATCRRTNDNNAIMAQLLVLGTNFVNFVGFNAYVGGDGEISGRAGHRMGRAAGRDRQLSARYAYPDWYAAAREERRRACSTAYSHRRRRRGLPAAARRISVRRRRQQRHAGLRRREHRQQGRLAAIITAPFSPLGHDTHIGSKNATCVALPTNQPIHPPRNTGDMMRVANQEQPFHPIYNYAFITDAQEGLILADVNTLADGEPRNNFLKRALTWNPNGVLTGARHIDARRLLRCTSRRQARPRRSSASNDPLQPQLVATVPLERRARVGAAVPLSVRDRRDGLKTIDVTDPKAPRLVAEQHDRARRCAARLRRAHVRLRRRRRGRPRDRRCRDGRKRCASISASMRTAR